MNHIEKEKSLVSVFMLIAIWLILFFDSPKVNSVNKVSARIALPFQPPASATLVLNSNPGWRFASGSHPVEGIDDNCWEIVSTPHAYHERMVVYQGFSKDIKDIGTFSQEIALIYGDKNGAEIYKDRPWTFLGLPEYLVSAAYLQVDNDDATAIVGESIIFKIGKIGYIYIVYDDGNVQFPIIRAPPASIKRMIRSPSTGARTPSTVVDR